MTSAYVLLPVLVTLGAGHLFDFKVISTRQSPTDGEGMCIKLGYDGLAIVSSPEMYNYALQLTEPIRKPIDAKGYGLFVGLHKSSGSNLGIWMDGTQVALDSPWSGSEYSTGFKTSSYYGIIHHAGGLVTLDGRVRERHALCGNHQNYPTEAHGVTAHGQQPAGVSSSLSVTKVMSYLECVLLCGQDHRCRAAEFNSDLLTCMILGPGSYSGKLTTNSKSQTFVRNGFN